MDMLRGEVSVEDQARYLGRGHYARVTAADRPGVAQPVPLREVPQQPWGRIMLGAAVLFALLLGGWEYYWRAFGVTPAYHNSNAEWAQQRRRIDAGEGSKTVLIGSSRILFDVQLPVWEKLGGERPIQLALEGTTPLLTMEDLAADPNFTGRLLVGVAPDLFFSGFAYRGDALAYFRKETPSQRAGNWLSRVLIEPWFAFFDEDYALAKVVKRQPWPARADLPNRLDVRKLSIQAADRSTHLWDKLVSDTQYRDLARSIWAQHLDGPPPPGFDTPEKMASVIDKQIQRAVDALVKLRARGVKVLFVRPPSDGHYLEFENKVFPRARTWDVLLARTGASGIHFQDYPELQGFELPEWSHIKHADAEKFTAALHQIIVRDFWPKDTAQALAPSQ